jgi:tetratricopeptide (TPR) repeat protein
LDDELSGSAESVDLPQPARAGDRFSSDIVDLPSPSGKFGAQALDETDLPMPSNTANLPSPSNVVDLPRSSGVVDLPAASSTDDLSIFGDGSGPIDSGESDPFGNIGLMSGPDGLTSSPSAGGIEDFAPPSGGIDASQTDSTVVDKTIFADSIESQLGEEFDPFAGSDVSESAFPGADAPLGSRDSLPPLGSTLGSGTPDIRSETGSSSSSLPKDLARVKASGTTNFGEISLGPAPSEGKASRLDTYEGEFDEFPTKEEGESRGEAAGKRGLDLAADPLDFDGAGSLVDEPVSQEELFEEGERRPAVTFSGRRKFERQSRRSKIMVFALVFVVGAGGAAMTLTDLGPFGVYALVSLIPRTGSEKLIQKTEQGLMRRLTTDTPHGLLDAEKEIQLILQEIPDDEDMRLLGIYVYNWHQIRFGTEKTYEPIIAGLLGSINLTQSESRFAPLARASEMVRAGNIQGIEGVLKGPVGQSTNGLSLLVTGYLKIDQYEKAVAIAKQLDAKENSARSSYLLARSYAKSGERQQAIEKLMDLVARYPEHIGVILMMAEVLLDIKPIQRDKIIELAQRVIKGGERISTNLEKAQAHALLGRLHLIERHSDLAKNELEEADKLNPSNFMMLIGKGEIALANGNFTEAAVAFNEAKVQEPNNMHAVLGYIETTLREGNLQEAKESLLKVLPKNQDNARAHYLLGLIQRRVKKLKEAEDEFNKAIELNDEYLEAYVSLSELYLEEKRRADVFSTLNKASEAIPESPLISQTLADAHAAGGDFATAIAELYSALNLDPECVQCHFRMAQLYRKMGYFEDAMKSLDEVEKRNPSWPGLAHEQGLLMELSGKVEDALKVYEEALKKQPDDINLKVRVAAASHILGRDLEAEKLLLQALGAQPDSPEINFYLGDVYRVLERGAEAAGLLKVAVDADSENALYHLRYGMALEDVHDVGSAMKEFLAAQKLDPKLAEVYVCIGEIQLNQGAAKDAIETLDKGIALDPTAAKAYELVAEAFEQLSDLRSAVAYYRRAVKVISDNADLFFKLSLSELNVYGYKAAIPSLTQAVKLGEQSDPKSEWLPEALYRLGDAQLVTGKRGGAIASFKRYLEIAPEDHLDRSEVLANMERLGFSME